MNNRQISATLNYDNVRMPGKLIVNGEEKDVIVTHISEHDEMVEDEYNGVVNITTYITYTSTEVIRTRQKRMLGWGE